MMARTKEQILQELQTAKQYMLTRKYGKEVRSSLGEVAQACYDAIEQQVAVVTTDVTDTDPNAAAQAAAVGGMLDELREEISRGELLTITNYGFLADGDDLNELLGTGTLSLLRNSFVALRGDYTFLNSPIKSGYLLTVGLNVSGSRNGLQVAYGKKGKVYTRILTDGAFSDWYDLNSGVYDDVKAIRLSVGPLAGETQNVISDANSAAIGILNTIEERNGFANGYSNKVAEGAYYAHAEGGWCEAAAEAAHAEGLHTTALGIASHSEGLGTIARGVAQSVRGQYNKDDENRVYAEIVGGGTSDSDRADLYTLDKKGAISTMGGLQVGRELFGVSTDAYAIAPNKDRYIWCDGYFSQTNRWMAADGNSLWMCSHVFPVATKYFAFTRTAIVHHAYFQMFSFVPFTDADSPIALASYGVSITGTPKENNRIVIGKRKPDRTQTGVPADDYVYFADGSSNLQVSFMDNGHLTEDYYQFVFKTVNGIAGWYDEYAHLAFIGDCYSETNSMPYIDRKHFSLSSNVNYIRIFAVYEATVEGSTVAVRDIASAKYVRSVFKITSDSTKTPNIGGMITFIDDDTSSKTLVQQYHDLFDSSHYRNIPDGYHMAGCYAVEAFRLLENPTITRMSLDASSDPSVLGHLEESYTPDYDATEAGPVLLETLKDIEEQGFEMIYHCMYQRGRAVDRHNTAYMIAGNERNPENLRIIRHNILTGLDAFSKLGVARWCRHWVTPYGMADEHIQSIARSLGFESLIRTGVGLTNPNVSSGLISRDLFGDRYSIPRWGYDYSYADGHGTPDAIKQVIDRAVATKSWIIIMSHVNAWGSDVDRYTNGFYDIVQHCIDSGIKIVSYSDGYEHYKETLLGYEKLT